MRNLVIVPNVANNRERMNLGEFAEEATIIMDEPVKPANHFIYRSQHTGSNIESFKE